MIQLPRRITWLSNVMAAEAIGFEDEGAKPIEVVENHPAWMC
jgi:hypothetical protein